MKKQVNKSVSEWYSQLLPTIDMLYKKYNYVYFEQNEYKKMVLSAINTITDISNSHLQGENINNQVMMQLESNIKNSIKKKLLDKTNTTSILLKYIENNKDIYYNISLIQQLDILANFIAQFSFDESIDFYINLLNINDLLNKLIKDIMDTTLKSTTINEISKLFKSDIAIVLIQAYCIINDIDIIENNDVLDCNELNLINTTDGVKFYFRQLNKQILTKEQEQKLFYQLLRGNTEARNILIESNLRLVVSYARKRLNRGLEFLDLIQEGNIGLIVAIDKFDVTKGYKFSTYASSWIQSAMDKAIVNKARTIRISVGMFNKIKKLNDMQRELVLKLGHEPSKQELAKYMHTSVNNIEQICEANKLPISINYKIGEKKESELGEFIPSSENLEDEALKSNYDDIIKKLKKCNLNNREILILTLRYGLNGDNPKTLEEIGKYLKITRQWVRQIEKNVLNRLRNPYNAKYFATDESLIKPVNNQNDDSHASYIKKNHY